MKQVNKHLLYILLLSIVMLLFGSNTFAQNVYDWKGTTSTLWSNAANWSENGGTASTYPGQGGVTTDIVNIGVSTSIPVFTRQPAVPAGVSYTIASLTFGNNNAPASNTTPANLQLTIGSGSTLTVSGTVLQKHSSTGGLANSGGLTEATGASTDAIITQISGPGTLHCTEFTVGDNTIPGNAYVNNNTWLFINASAVVTVDDNFTLNSVSSHQDGDQTVITRNNDPFVSFQSGTLTVNNQLKLMNTNPWAYVIDPYYPQTSFSIDQSTANATLNFGGANPLNISIGGTYYCLNYVDFYNPPPTGDSGQSTVTFLSAGNQQVYNSQSYPTYALDQTPTMYQNISFGGSGTKTFDIGTTTLDGNLTLNAGSEVVDLSVNTSSVTLPGALTVGSGSTLLSGAGAISVTGNVTNSGTITLGSGNFSMANNFTNSGTFNCGSSTVIFNSTTTALLNDSAPGGTTFNNVNFTSGNNAVMQSGTFAISSQGVMTLSNSGTKVTAGGGNLIFKSDVNGSATLAALPTGCMVNGTVTVQRYVSANRAYRLMSSPVNSGSKDGNGNYYYDVNYLLTNTVLTGTNFPNNGVSSKSGNPTLYLWRENLIPQYTTFLNSNFIGIADISNLTSYVMNDATYTNTDIPVGNGYLFYYRGSIKQSNLAALTTAGAAATTDTLNATGTINYGNITVHPWYLPTQSTLGWSTVDAADPTVQGINLVGNPYPSSIDWDQYGSGIVESNVASYSYQLIPTGAQGAGNYNVYAAGSNIGGNKQGTQGTPNSNVIASGEGFLVQALNSSASLMFTESAKTNKLNTGANLYMGKPPVAKVEQYIHLQLALDTINTDGTIIEFNANAKPAYDPKEDAHYKVGTGKVSLSSLSSDNAPVAFNQLPLALKGDTIHLKVGASTSGNYKFNVKSVSGVPQLYNVYLADALTKDTTDLRKTTSYSFTINTADTTTLGSHRFSLLINQNPLLQYKLLTFTADQVGQSKHVQLNWTTVNEQNYTNFTVERSNDNGKTYVVVGGMVSTGAGAYGLVDKDAQDGDNIYRLKQEDFNNTITYSQLVHVQVTEHGDKDHFTCFPNPAINTINLSFLPKAQDKTTYDLKISNSSGIVVKYAVLTDTNWQGNVSSFLTGTYLIQVVDRKDNSVIGQAKFVKL